MAYVISDSCIKCKYMDCVEVCPVDCFYEGETMLVIHPDQCIDCGVCEPECPADAIVSDTAPGAAHWQEINRKYADLWPSVTRKREPAADADQWKGIAGKFDKFFTAAPGPSKTSGV
jgi:ferredoxin